MPASSRPPGVALLALFVLFAGLVLLLLAWLGRMLGLDLAPALVYSLLPLGLLLLGVAWGLWRLAPWARRLLLLIAVLGAAASLLSIFAAGPGLRLSTLTARLFLLPVCGLIVWYLFWPQITRAFRR